MPTYNPCKGKIQRLENQVGRLHPTVVRTDGTVKINLDLLLAAVAGITEAVSDVMECISNELPKKFKAQDTARGD